MPKIVAVVVTFRPDPSLLPDVLGAALAQVDEVVVADNGDGFGLPEPGSSGGRLSVIRMLGNRGVAAAQNAGIEAARALGASHVLLLDHDSICAPGMVATLVGALDALGGRGKRVAAVGANYVDARRPSHRPFLRFDGLLIRRPDPQAAGTLPEVSFLISSGCLIPMSALDAIGPMMADLFIDCVDVEWGLRATMAGWSSHGVVDARLEHRLGDAPIHVFGRTHSLHAPLRDYYMVRNSIWLCLHARLRFNWRLIELFRVTRRCVAYLVFAPDRLQRAGMMLRGLADGAFERLGAWRPAQERTR